MGINKNKRELLDKGKLWVEQYPCSVTVLIIVILLDLLAWKVLGFSIFLEKKKVEKLLTFDNLYNIFSSLPCAAKGTYPDRAENSLDLSVSNIYIKDKDKTAVIEKGLVH